MIKCAARISWDVLLKIAAVDPAIADRVRRVAERMKYEVPSQAELDAMFPSGWEKTAPSWQSQFESSDWLKGQNTQKMYTEEAARGSAGAPSSGVNYGPYNSGHNAPSWVSQTAANVASSDPYRLGWIIPSLGSALLAPSVKRKIEQESGLSAGEKKQLLRMWGRSGSIGAGAGLLGGLGLGAAATLPYIRSGTGGASPYLSSLIMAAPGVSWGSSIGNLIGMARVKKKLNRLKQKQQEILDKDAA